MPKKSYVLDTNVPLHDPEAILEFEENDVFIPITVIEILDGLKRGDGEIPYSARQALRLIDSFREQGDIHDYAQGIRKSLERKKVVGVHSFSYNAPNGEL